MFTAVIKRITSEKLRKGIHEVGRMSHKGIAQGALPASGGVDENKGEK